MPKSKETQGPGRPKGSTSRKPTKDLRKMIRWTKEEWSEVQAVAKREDTTASDFVRESALSRCQAVRRREEGEEGQKDGGKQ